MVTHSSQPLPPRHGLCCVLTVLLGAGVETRLTDTSGRSEVCVSRGQAAFPGGPSVKSPGWPPGRGQTAAIMHGSTDRRLTQQTFMCSPFQEAGSLRRWHRQDASC